MIKRLSQISLVFIIASNLSIVAVDNILDYNSNYQFVKNVLSMDTTFPENKLMWRKIVSSFWWNALYIFIIAWEFAVAIICWIGIIKLIKKIKFDPNTYEKAKGYAITGLTLCLLLYGFIFITVAGEWFLMWQSTQWNGEVPATRLFLISGISLIYLSFKNN